MRQNETGRTDATVDDDQWLGTSGTEGDLRPGTRGPGTSRTTMAHARQWLGTYVKYDVM